MDERDRRKLEEMGFIPKVVGSDPGIVVWCRTEGTPSEEEGGTYVDFGGDYFNLGMWSETQDVAESMAEIWLPCFQKMIEFFNERIVMYQQGEISFDTTPGVNLEDDDGTRMPEAAQVEPAAVKNDVILDKPTKRKLAFKGASKKKS